MYRAFNLKQAHIITDRTEPYNPVLVVKKANNTLRIPQNKSEVWLNGQKIRSDGVNVFNSEKWYVAQNVIDLIK